MVTRDPVKNFEFLWETFHNRYPFFKLRNVDWGKQYDTYRPKISDATDNKALFHIFCEMLDPLNDGHVALRAKIHPDRKPRYFTAEKKPRFHREFTKREIRQLFKTTQKTLLRHGFSKLRQTDAWMLRYCRSAEFGYMRILELEDIKKRTLRCVLDLLARDFASLKGMVIDIRDNPGGEDDIALAIIDRFCDRKRVAFRRKTKIGAGKDDFRPLKTWYIKPRAEARFTSPVVLLTCDSVFSGGEAFALAIRELPHVTIIGDHTNGIFSYQRKKKLPNGWTLWLPDQVYFSADMICYEGKGVPPDIKLLNKRSDIEKGVDPLILRAVKVLRSKTRV